jgi:hypothetical protein
MQSTLLMDDCNTSVFHERFPSHTLQVGSLHTATILLLLMPVNNSHEQASLDAGLIFQPKWKGRFLCVMQIAVSVASHIQELGGLTHSLRYEVLESASREDLTAKWQEWVQAAGDLFTS